MHKALLHDIIAERVRLPGARVIWSYENGRRPPLPFVLLRVYGDHPAAGRMVSQTDTPGILSVRAPYECTLQVQYFGCMDEDAVEILTDLAHWFAFPSVTDRLFAAGVAVYDAGGVNDISTVLDSLAYERRAALEISVRYDRAEEDDVGYISAAEIEEKLDERPERIIRVEWKGELTNGDS